MTLQHGLDRMPQKGPMQLLERIVSADDTEIDCIARPHHAHDYPLRIDGILPTLALVELGAQAAAAHASLFGIGGNHAGLLLALHGVEVSEDAEFDTAAQFHASASRLHFDENGARYAFEIKIDNQLILSGQAMLKMEAVGP